MFTVFARGKLDFFLFLVGSVGLFGFMMLWIQPFLLTALTELVTSASGVLGKISGMYEAYPEHSILFIRHDNSAVSLYINYECSGIIEMMAFVSLICFYRVYGVMQRIIVSFMGCVGIFIANVLRLFIICATVYVGGNDYYYVAHTIVGRFVFYLLSAIMYYYAFTYAQIINQKVGGFSYGSSDDKTLK